LIVLLAISGTVLAAEPAPVGAPLAVDPAPSTPTEGPSPTAAPSSDAADGPPGQINSTRPKSGGPSTKASTEISGYADTDHVYVLTPSVAGSIADEVAGWSVSGHYLVDVVSAASVDIVSTASNKWSEYRHAGSLEGSMKIDSSILGVSGVISREPDYLSLTGGGTWSLDLLDKNVTPYIGFSYGRDQVGRTGLPSEFWQTKRNLAGRLGVTFVIDRSSIASLQADVVDESGYLAKPYRYVPLFAPGEGGSIAPGASVTEVNSRRLDPRPAEQLPNARHRFALSGRLAHRLSTATLRVDQRAYADSWGLLASTTDFRFIVDAGRRFSIWPHLRFHIQNGVVFWQRAYEVIPGPGGALGVPVLRTGDRELSPLFTGTGGLGMRFRLIDDLRKPWSLLFDFDASTTRYLDTLYITKRQAVFSTLAVEAQF
jgi:hypothetical protein